MADIKQQFKFPKKLWFTLSSGLFLALFFKGDVCYKNERPTAFGNLVTGDFGMCIFGSAIWLIIAVGIGAYVAAMFGIVKSFFSKHKKLSS